ncbi:hypothetical protein [Caulobacter henricii]|nr:hypothetical protein [Caulobacter henricii]
MTTADDHWPATLQRVVALLHFKLADPKANPQGLTVEVRQDLTILPALIQTAVKAAIELDQWVAAESKEAPVNREAIVARKQFLRALIAEPPGSTRSPFTMGYDAAYRLRLEKLIWAAIADHPRRRLEELAAARP